ISLARHVEIPLGRGLDSRLIRRVDLARGLATLPVSVPRQQQHQANGSPLRQNLRTASGQFHRSSHLCFLKHGSLAQCTPAWPCARLGFTCPEMVDRNRLAALFPKLALSQNPARNAANGVLNAGRWSAGSVLPAV